ncbi:MAG TPA: hypothetical protein VFA37_10665 [Gaiellaceae bacterium]|nr:hypothetical protein [Gaiellaceae bacterium]
MSPDFDEIVGTDDGERERLRRVHELLVTAGPPPELTPRLERTPSTQGSVFWLPRVPAKHRTTLLFAAALVVLAAFFGGYGAGKIHRSTSPESLLSLRGTATAPHAVASLQIFAKQAGNWPMTLTVADLPKLPSHAYYEVFLVRNGKPYLSCGEFTVDGGSAPLTVQLNAPYVFQHGDTWVVTKQLPGTEKPGPTVLKPV